MIINRNITTYHAEDGSGVGSAIIAGLLLLLPSVLGGSLLTFLPFSYDEEEKGFRLVSSFVKRLS